MIEWYSRVSLAVEHPIVRTESFFYGNVVVRARVQMDQIDHVRERPRYSDDVRRGQNAVEVIEELPKRLNLREGIYITIRFESSAS